MRFLAFLDGTERGLALVGESGRAIALRESDRDYPGSLLSIISEGRIEQAAGALAQGREVRLDSLRILPPIEKPPKIICVGLNYRDHATETNTALPSHPTIFARFASSLVASGEPIICPMDSDQLDYEGEVVAIVGKRGRRIPRSDALVHVAGYSIFNDGSVRDVQLRTPQWTLGKNYDATGAFGPYFVTADSLPAGARGLKIETRLNGTTVQSANTDDLIFDVATLISHLSEAFTLEPGDLIVTGTPAGVGLARKPPLFMKEGDVCEVQVETIGVLQNPIRAEVRRKTL
jgi:acylpyruvate hydrolase